MALVVMGAPLGHARQHRFDRLGAVERLDLALLVDTEHQRALRRRQIEPNDIADLLHEERVRRQLERLGAVRLQAERTPDAPDRGMRQPGRLCHRAQRPVGRVGRGGGQRPLDHLGDPLVREGPWPSRPGFVRQPLEAVLDETPAPLGEA